jgi:hypothetical protein
MQLTNREQYLMSIISDLMMLIKEMDEGRVANSYAIGCVTEAVTAMSDNLALEYDELAWLLAFLSAGPAMSESAPPPAEAPPEAGEASGPPPADEPASSAAEHPNGGSEASSASYGRTGGLTY